MQTTKVELSYIEHIYQQLNGIINLLQSYSNPNLIPSLRDLEQYFSPNFQMISNDKKVCQDLNAFISRILTIQKRFSSIRYSNFLENPLVANHRAVIRYNIDLVKTSGQKAQFQILAILTFEADKVVKWVEVIHEKGTGAWDT